MSALRLTGDAVEAVDRYNFENQYRFGFTLMLFSRLVGYHTIGPRELLPTIECWFKQTV